VTEAELLESVRMLAGRLGLLAIHRHDSRRDAGWAGGFPDLVIASPAGLGLLFAELKSSTGALSGDQQRWRRALMANSAAYVVWRPEDWHSGEICIRLQGLARAGS
jgi:hypothetical protein